MLHRIFYLAWLVIAAMLGVPRALATTGQGPAYSSALQQPAAAGQPLWLHPLRFVCLALWDMAACPALWWPQVCSTPHTRSVSSALIGKACGLLGLLFVGRHARTTHCPTPELSRLHG